MLRAEDGPHLHPRGPQQQAESGAPGGVDAGVIGDHPDVFAFQGGEAFGRQDLDARLYPVRGVAGAMAAHDQVCPEAAVEAGRPMGTAAATAAAILARRALTCPRPLG